MSDAALKESPRVPDPGTRRLRGTFWRYSLLGGLSLVVNLVVVGALRELVGLSTAAAGAAGYAAVLLLNFVLARRHVFMSSAAIAPELLRFGLVQVGMRVAEYLTFLLLVYRAGFGYSLAIVVVAGAFFVAKFWMYRSYVFGSRSDPGDVGAP